MTVYVDELRNWGAPWKGGMSCHMYADTDPELFAFAEQIGLPLRWLDRRNPDPILVHFDLSPSWREKAISNGAQSVSNHDTGLFIRQRRLAAKNHAPAT